uniref:Uncharacterized protein n=1 Tax=Physcomitrium patens TaxID=3218 RepID=A0A7I4F260_PHYPA
MVKDNKIKKEVLRYLKKVGYNLYKILFVSILGFEGDNMIESLTNFKWYMSPTLDNMKIKETISQAFEAIANESKKRIIKPNILVYFASIGLIPQIKLQNMHHKFMLEAYWSENIGFNANNMSMKNLKRKKSNNNYALVIDYYTSYIIVNFFKILKNVEKQSNKELQNVL